jgi:hypothetical protein
MWGSVRGAPEISTQLFPASTPHVGQGTEYNCLGVSSLFFIRAECYHTRLQNRSVLNILLTSRYPFGRTISCCIELRDALTL